ncbi:TonB-dependent receptor [Dyella tabacisoli]|uniref:TonB-dependent receptor n=1 Tax=Dyella tabacisoli TaxID=2282381 RepID=UPI0036137BFF
MNFKTTTLRDSIVVALIAGCAAFASTATAQETAKTLDRIVVTGSNIPRIDTETASPVQVISRQEIERSGKATIAEYLQTLTSDGAGSIPKTFGNGFAGGGTGISLRGLGAGSTLVLLNGRRMAPFGLADDGQKVFTDLSTIPMEAVDRIEVLKDGASAIYGSDAIAGVVNVILRKDFTGAVIKGSYGVSDSGDGNQWKGSITAGMGDLAKDRYNVFFSLEGTKTEEMLVRDRTDRDWIGTGDLRPWGYNITSSQNLAGAITGGGTVASSSPVGSIRNPATGIYKSLPGCSTFSQITPVDPGGGCLWQAGQFRSLTPNDKTINFFVRGSYALSDHAELYSEFGYSNKQTKFHTTPSGVSGTWGYPGGPVNASSGPGAVVLGANHPDNPLGVPARLRYAAFDVGPRTILTDNDFYRFLVGIKGSFGEWDYDVGYLHSETSMTNERHNFLRYSHVRTALTDPNSPVGYWRIGQNSYLNSRALYDYISPAIQADAASKLDSIDGRVSRSLMDLPGGSLGLSIGGEYRRQSVSLSPQTYTDIGDIIGLGFSSYRGVQQVGAAYVELVAPVLKTVELSAAMRVDAYRHGDSSTTPKVGIKWTPAEWVALRATYAEGFRAPNPAESGKGGLAAFSNAQDPVRCPNGTPVPGGIATQADCNAAIAIITSPNPNLKPEESKSYTLGLVLDPTPTTSLTIDAWRIKRSNEINQGDTAAAILAGNVTRSDNNLPGIPNSGTLMATSVGYINSASTTVRGIDLDVRQRFEMGEYGRLRLDLQWSRVNSFERKDQGITRQYAGTHGNCDTTNCIGTPKDRINFGATWDINTFTFGAVVNYIGSFKNIRFKGDVCANTFADGSPAPNGCKIPSFYTVDLTGRWKPAEAWEIFGSIQNAFDKTAPLDPLTYGAMGYNPLHSSGAIGRYYTIGARYAFK